MTWLWVVLPFLVFAAFAISLWLRSALKTLGRKRAEQNAQALESAREIVSIYFRAILQGDYSRAYQVAGDLFWDRISFEDFVAQQRALIMKLGPLRRVAQVRERSGLNKDGWWVEIRERSHYDNGDSEDAFFFNEDPDDAKLKLMWTKRL